MIGPFLLGIAATIGTILVFAAGIWVGFKFANHKPAPYPGAELPKMGSTGTKPPPRGNADGATTEQTPPAV